jgi:uncharacterized OB-fold protein
MTDGAAEAALRPLPWPDAISQGPWAGARAHELHIQRCAECRRWIHLPAIRCATCGSLDLGYERASGRATLHSWTMLHEPPAPGFRSMLPLILGVVELDEQPMLLMSANIVGADPAALRLGMKLEAMFDEADADTILIQFQPAES